MQTLATYCLPKLFARLNRRCRKHDTAVRTRFIGWDVSWQDEPVALYRCPKCSRTEGMTMDESNGRPRSCFVTDQVW